MAHRGGSIARRLAGGLAAVCAFVCALGVLASLSGGCGRSASVPPPSLKVVVTIAPLAGLVRAMVPGGEVRVLMTPGRSEHGYEFTPEDLAAVASADVLVLVGLGLEPRVEEEIARRAVAKRRVVRFADVVGLDAAGEKARDAGHEPGEASAHGHDDARHHHPRVDQHLWLDPALVKELVPAVRDAIAGAMRDRGAWNDESGAALDRGRDTVLALVADVDREYSGGLAPFRGRAIVTHHNAFSRVAERYGLRVAAAIREYEDSEPTPAEVAAIVEAIRREQVRTIFVEPQFNPAAAERIAKAAGVSVGTLDPLGDAALNGDWGAMMRANLAQLTRRFGGEPGGR